MWTAVVDIAVIKERGGEATCVHTACPIQQSIMWRIKKLNRQWDVLKGQAIK